MKETKEPRDRQAEYNLLSPVELIKLGTDNDPCFGTHDAKDGSCKICGDSLSCQLQKQQLTHLKRSEVEKIQSFKDIEMEVENTYLDSMEVEALMLKSVKDGAISKVEAYKIVNKKLNPSNRIEPEHIKKVILTVVRQNEHLKFIKQNNKRYIQWKK